MILTFDFEVTTHNMGSVFDPRNKAVCLGIKEDNKETYCLNFLEHQNLTALQSKFDGSSLLVGFNLKFDTHWLRRLGLTFDNRPLHCCQIAEFLLSGQRQPYPSLEQAAQKYGLGHKIDVVKLEWWDKGYNTDIIPTEILHEYCMQDVELTYKVYLRQKEQLEKMPKVYQLFKLMCQDLLVLEEMEWNGLKYDEELCKKREEELSKEIASIKYSLSTIYSDVPINFGSGDQLSAFLYGGSIPNEVTKHVGFYKNGNPKYKKVDEPFILPRLVEPLKNSELKKEGVFKTNEETLRKLKGPAAKKFVGPLLRLAELEKLVNTYYRGLPEKNKEGHWPPGMIHGQFNQCVTQTGRLSSSKPNAQNFAEAILDIFISRYE